MLKTGFSGEREVEVTVDECGRILMPEDMRNELGIAPGMRLNVEQIGQDILLHMPAAEPVLRNEGGVLVYCGQLTGDADAVIQQVREQR